MSQAISTPAIEIAAQRMKHNDPATKEPRQHSSRAAGPARRQRRKDARPGEIIDVAVICFLESGYEATKLDDVARRAGVAKGTVYLYFETKEHLFRAVVQQVTSTNVRQLGDAIRQFDGPIAAFIPLFLSQAVSSIGESQGPRIAALILKESDRFPDLGRIWVEEVVSPMFGALKELIERAQGRGEIREGDPLIHVFSLIGPVFAAILSRHVLAPLGFARVDLPALAEQHAITVLSGFALPPKAASTHDQERKRPRRMPSAVKTAGDE